MFYVSDDPQGIFTVESDGCVAKRKSWIVENNTLGQKGLQRSVFNSKTLAGAWPSYMSRPQIPPSTRSQPGVPSYVP